MKKETCEKCGGKGGDQMEDGFMPCFHCKGTGYQTSKPRNYEAEQEIFNAHELALITGEWDHYESLIKNADPELVRLALGH